MAFEHIPHPSEDFVGTRGLEKLERLEIRGQSEKWEESEKLVVFEMLEEARERE